MHENHGTEKPVEYFSVQLFLSFIENSFSDYKFDDGEFLIQCLLIHLLTICPFIP
jgi:hypothetical protein